MPSGKDILSLFRGFAPRDIARALLPTPGSEEGQFLYLSLLDALRPRREAAPINIFTSLLGLPQQPQVAQAPGQIVQPPAQPPKIEIPTVAPPATMPVATSPPPLAVAPLSPLAIAPVAPPQSIVPTRIDTLPLTLAGVGFAAGKVAERVEGTPFEIPLSIIGKTSKIAGVATAGVQSIADIFAGKQEKGVGGLIGGGVGAIAGSAVPGVGTLTGATIGSTFGRFVGGLLGGGPGKTTASKKAGQAALAQFEPQAGVYDNAGFWMGTPDTVGTTRWKIWNNRGEIRRGNPDVARVVDSQIGNSISIALSGSGLPMESVNFIMGELSKASTQFPGALAGNAQAVVDFINDVAMSTGHRLEPISPTFEPVFVTREAIVGGRGGGGGFRETPFAGKPQQDAKGLFTTKEVVQESGGGRGGRPLHRATTVQRIDVVQKGSRMVTPPLVKAVLDPRLRA